MADDQAGPPDAPVRRRRKFESKDEAVSKIQAKAARDHSFAHRKLIGAFLEQHAEDLAMRRRYAVLLIRILIAQVVVIHVLLILLGFGRHVGFDLDPWTARSFVIAVFAEICVFVGIVARYLFTPSVEKILDVLDRFRAMRLVDVEPGTEESS